jgi:hypothetical protein
VVAAQNPIADFVAIFVGNGTATHPDAGLLFGNGFSYSATSCASGTACNGGRAGLVGNGGDGFNGGKGGSAVLVGDGGDGGNGAIAVNDGAPGTGGSGGLFSGSVGQRGTPAAVLGTIPLAGGAFGQTVVSADGARALVTTFDGKAYAVVTVDTATGAQIGAAIALKGHPSVSPLLLNASGSRALVTTSGGDVGTLVTVMDTAAGTQTATEMVGTAYMLPKLSADGSRALITTEVDDATTAVAVIDTATGRQLGTTLMLTGTSASLVLIAGGSRALITTDLYAYGGAPEDTTAVTTIDTATGTQFGVTVTFTSGGPHSMLLSDDGSRAVITTDYHDIANPVDTTTVTIIDTGTGTQIGTTLTLAGGLGMLLRGGDDNHVVVGGTLYDYSTANAIAQAVVVDTATGTQVGTTVELPGYGGPRYTTADGSYAVLTAQNFNGATYSTSLTAINTTTGMQVGTPFTVDGTLATRHLIMSADGTHFVVVTDDGDPYSTTHTTWLTVIDATTGTRTGVTVTAPGAAQDPLDSGNPPVAVLLRADGTRSLVISPFDGLPIGGLEARVTMIDTISGTQSFNWVAGLPAVGSLAATADGALALVTTNVVDPSGWMDTRVTVINTATGAQSATTLVGVPLQKAVFTPDGTRAVIVTDTGVSVLQIDGSNGLGSAVE